jgi:hypothetical protein
MPELFTVEEINLMCAFNTESREKLIAELIGATDRFEDGEMLEIAVAVLERLTKMSGADFAALELNPAYEDYEEQEA